MPTKPGLPKSVYTVIDESTGLTRYMVAPMDWNHKRLCNKAVSDIKGLLCSRAGNARRIRLHPDWLSLAKSFNTQPKLVVTEVQTNIPCDQVKFIVGEIRRLNDLALSNTPTIYKESNSNGNCELD